MAQAQNAVAIGARQPFQLPRALQVSHRLAPCYTQKVGKKLQIRKKKLPIRAKSGILVKKEEYRMELKENLLGMDHVGIPTTAAMRTMPSYSSSSPVGSTQTTFSPSASIFSMASCCSVVEASTTSASAAAISSTFGPA